MGKNQQNQSKKRVKVDITGNRMLSRQYQVEQKMDEQEIKGSLSKEDYDSIEEQNERQSQQQFFSQSQQSEEEYDVEKIINRKQYQDTFKYLIKWRDYPDSDNTWEPQSNLERVSKYVKAFDYNVERGIKQEITIPLSDSDNQNQQKQKEIQSALKTQQNGENKENLGKQNVRFDVKEKKLQEKSKHQQYSQIQPEKLLQKRQIIQKSEKYEEFHQEFESISSQQENSEGDQINQLINLQKDQIQRTFLNNGFRIDNLLNQGGIESGDQVRSLMQIFQNDKGVLMATVSWNQRADGYSPENSNLPTTSLREFAPDLLIDFYESHITFRDGD